MLPNYVEADRGADDYYSPRHRVACHYALETRPEPPLADHADTHQQGLFYHDTAATSKDDSATTTAR